MNGGANEDAPAGFGCGAFPSPPARSASGGEDVSASVSLPTRGSQVAIDRCYQMLANGETLENTGSGACDIDQGFLGDPSRQGSVSRWVPSLRPVTIGVNKAHWVVTTQAWFTRDSLRIPG
ncbi:MAG: hypothetical protein QG597_1766 [Actinomycetota bacterium]|jgi:hypothetical protein|nr:hypothetical protein [Actinomycetota bacterium]